MVVAPDFGPGPRASGERAGEGSQTMFGPVMVTDHLLCFRFAFVSHKLSWSPMENRYDAVLGNVAVNGKLQS